MALKILSAALLFVAAMSGVASAGFAAPEISPADMSTGIALFVGGALMLTDRLRRK